MTFPLSPASPFTATITKVTASFLNGIRAALPAAVDGVGGGTYNLGIGNTLWFPSGGGNITIDAALGISAAFVPSGGNFTIDGGGFLTVAPDGLVSLVGTSGHLAILDVGAFGLIQLDSGAVLTVTGSANVKLYGVQTVESTGSIVVNGDGGITFGGTSGHPGAAIWAQYATALWQSGSFLTCLSGSTVGLAGTTSIAGAATVTSTGSITVAAGGVLTTDQPTSNAVPTANNIKVTDVPKAWAQITTHSGAAVVDDGINVSNSFSYPSFGASHAIKVTWALAFSSATYAVTVTSTAASGGAFIVPFIVSKTAADCTIVFGDVTTTPPTVWDPSTANFAFHVNASGRQ